MAPTATKPLPQPNIGISRGVRAAHRVLGIDRDLSHVIIRESNRKLTVEIGDAIVDAKINRSVRSASNVEITVDDPERKLLSLPLTKSKFHLSIDGLHFRYKGYDKEGNTATFKLIEANAARMMEVYGVRKAYRDEVTRAEFILSEVREAKGSAIPVHIFELHKRQPVKSAKDISKKNREQTETGELHTQGQHGLGKADEGKITVKGTAASLGQIHIIDEVLATGESMGANFKVLVTSIMTITQESAVSNISSSEGYGVFSQLKNGAWPASGDPATDAHAFFREAIKEDKDNPGLSKNDLAQAVQASGVPGAYAQWEDEAVRTTERYLGGDAVSGGGSTSETVFERYPFERAEKESAWLNTGKLAGQVHWRRFMVAGKFFYIPETQLYKSQVRLRLDEDEQGVEDISGPYHENIEVTELTVTAHAKHWKVPPGCVVEITENMGPFEGRYLVENIEASMIDSEDLLEIKIAKPVDPLPEPPPPSHTKTISIPGGESASSADAPSNVKVTSTAPGAPYWGGCAALFKQFIHPFMEDHGLQPDSEKEEGHTEGSDHALYSLSAYATDYPASDTPATTRIANEIGQALGRSGNSVGTFERFNITVDNIVFSIQILWHVKDHYDHIHVGVNRG